jgi:hypothetical protein
MTLPTSAIRDIIQHRTGLRSFTTPRGIRVMELDLTANPMHTPEWIQAARTRYSSEREWRREMMRDWTTPSGAPYFPEFAEIGPIRFIRPVTKLIKGPVYRSYDFGKRCPACTWFQYSQKGDRLWLYREFLPQDLQTHEFRDAVRYLSGQLRADQVPPRGMEWIRMYGAKPSGGHCPPPWFPLGTHFIDITGKEALQGQSNAILPELATVQGIFSEMGMNLIIQNPRVMARYQVMRRFLRVYDDGLPGLLIDPQCEEAIDMFSGKLCYPDATPANPVPTKPKNDGHLINLSDAFTYGVVMVAPADAPKPNAPERLVGYRHGREPVYQADSEEVGWAECRPRL